MLGGRYLLIEKDNWNISGALFAGMANAYGETKATSALVSLETKTKYSGSDAVGLLLLGWQTKIGENTFFGVDAGYRQMSIKKMNVDSTSTSAVSSGGGGFLGYAPSKASRLDASGKELKYDFSGMVLNVGVNFKF
jgi:hypothetical protein